MNHKLLSIFIFISLFSCRTSSNSDRAYADGDPNKVYKLRLNPPAGAQYDYDISNGSEFKLEVNGKKLDNLNNAQVTLDYIIDKDSTGNFTLHLRYDKIKIHYKIGDTESDLDAGNTTSLDPTERMLSFIKNAKIKAVLSPVGEMRSISGLKEIVTGFMAQFTGVDPTTRQAIQEKWNSLVGGNLVTGNMEQLFRIFPDSGVHIGDKWKLGSKQKADFALNGNNNYTLNAIRDGVAYIRSDGEMASDSVAVTMMGYQVTPSLKGYQHGDYQMETATGMMLNATITSTVEGTISMMGQDIPVTIETSIKMNRR